MTPSPGPDQPPAGRSSTDRPTTPDEATAVPSPELPDADDQHTDDQDPDRPSPDRPHAVTLPADPILDGYYWERRRRSAMVPITVGVLGLTAIGLVQGLPARHAVEQDLTDRSAQALRAAGVEGVTVRFSGRDGTLKGAVTSPAERDSAVSAVRRVTGVRVAHDRLSGPGRPGTGSGSGSAHGNKPGTTPPAVPRTPPQVTARLHEGRLTLAGSVPSSEARAELVTAVRAAVQPNRISSRISVNRQVTVTGLGGLARVLRALGPDADVTVELRDDRLTLTGGVASARQIRQAVAAGVSLTGDRQRVVNRLSVDQRVAVAAALRALPPVTFRTAYSTPTEQDEVTLRRLAGVLATNPDVKLQVRGYTDDVGDEDMNYGLSYARARTVSLRLQQQGIARSRLSFQAFGEKDPKLPNTSAANRAANRRVEFRLMP
jgi:outer membrane protein OmpA-like peptidoglycan-associated protein